MKELLTNEQDSRSLFLVPVALAQKEKADETR